MTAKDTIDVGQIISQLITDGGWIDIRTNEKGKESYRLVSITEPHFDLVSKPNNRATRPMTLSEEDQKIREWVASFSNKGEHYIMVDMVGPIEDIDAMFADKACQTILAILGLTDWNHSEYVDEDGNTPDDMERLYAYFENVNEEQEWPAQFNHGLLRIHELYPSISFEPMFEEGIKDENGEVGEWKGTEICLGDNESKPRSKGLTLFDFGSG